MTCQPKRALLKINGWHWVRLRGEAKARPMEWSGSQRGWVGMGPKPLTGEDGAALGWTYEGPCSIPAEVAAIRAENDTLRAMLARSNEPCPYCSLPAADINKCALGFPGCGRMDDIMKGDEEKTRAELFNAGLDLSEAHGQIERLTAALRVYQDEQCEGFCKEHEGWRGDCAGCIARLALAGDKTAPEPEGPF